MTSLQISTFGSFFANPYYSMFTTCANPTCSHSACIVETVLIKMPTFLQGHLSHVVYAELIVQLAFSLCSNYIMLPFSSKKRTSTHNSDSCYEDQGDAHLKRVIHS